MDKICWPNLLQPGQTICVDGTSKGWNLASVSPPFTDTPIHGPMILANHPPAMLVQPSFDSREVAQRLTKKALNFIEESAGVRIILKQ
jgi:hypothetical protein